MKKFFIYFDVFGWFQTLLVSPQSSPRASRAVSLILFKIFDAFGRLQTPLALRAAPLIRGEFLPDKGGCSVERSETRWVWLQQAGKWKIFGWCLFLSSFIWRRGTACGGGFFFILYAFGDPLLSASNKSGQKCLSAHFAISNNVSLRSPLVKFEAEPNPWDRSSAIWQMKNFWLFRAVFPFRYTNLPLPPLYQEGKKW